MYESKQAHLTGHTPSSSAVSGSNNSRDWVAAAVVVKAPNKNSTANAHKNTFFVMIPIWTWIWSLGLREAANGDTLYREFKSPRLRCERMTLSRNTDHRYSIILGCCCGCFVSSSLFGSSFVDVFLFSLLRSLASSDHSSHCIFLRTIAQKNERYC